MSWEDNLDDFERQLAKDRELRERGKTASGSRSTDHKDSDDRRKRHRRRDGNGDHPSGRHRHDDRHTIHHRDRGDHERKNDDRANDDGHRHKRRRRSSDQETDGGRGQSHRHRREDDTKHERLAVDDKTGAKDRELQSQGSTLLKRDAWMEAPSALDVDYVHRADNVSQSSLVAGGSNKANFEQRLREAELNQHHVEQVDTGDKDLESKGVEQDTTDYEFGDSGSRWRLMKLRNTYREAEESGRNMEEVALERYSSLKAFDAAREEEIEMDRRQRYGEGYLGKSKPSGELFAERNIHSGEQDTAPKPIDASYNNDKIELAASVGNSTGISRSLDAPGASDLTALNRLRAQLIKARLKGSPEVKQLEDEYQRAQSASAHQEASHQTMIGVMENRMLAGGRQEVKQVLTKRGLERGHVEENENMTIDDMVREERRTKGVLGDEDMRFASRIAKDGKFTNDLDYLDENATKLAKRVHQSDATLRSKAIADHRQTENLIASCPLCYQENRDNDVEPAAPVVSLGHRSYLTLPTRPEITSQTGAVIVPLAHHDNLLHCDDDEWEEIRNFMKSLMRLYFSRGLGVLFYENAARPRQHRHAALICVPVPQALAEDASAFFREAILASDDEWAQHRKIIDTRGKGRSGFRRSVAKEVPYFHVWTELDGGLGHVIEDERRWPKGDLFAREVLGGMLRTKAEIWRKQGRWEKGSSEMRERVAKFRKAWDKYDWTKMLLEN